MAVILYEDTHDYYDDGVWLPSTTHITRFVANEKLKQAPEWQRKVAADRGRRVHEYCQLLDYGALPKFVDLDCIGYLTAYKAFLRDFNVKEWLHCELVLGSNEKGFAGTLDRVGIIDGELTILDIKTSASLDYHAVAAQLAGYCILYGKPAILRPLLLRKDGTYREPKPIDWNFAVDRFNAAFTLHKLMEEKHG